MKRLLKAVFIFSALIITMMALSGCGSSSPLLEDRTVIGETYTLEDDRILNGNLNVIGGVVEVEQRATVNGNLFVLGGLVTIDGTIKGDLTAIGGTVNLSETAVLEGDLISPVSYINVNQDAQVLGEEINEWIFPSVGLEQLTNLASQTYVPETYSSIRILTKIGEFLAFTLVLVALGAVVVLVMPKPAERMIAAISNQPWHLLGFGALTTLVMASVLILSITICLIPFVILVGLVYAVAVLVGWLMLGYLVGKRIASGIFNATWHPVLTAALGNLVLYLVAWGVNRIPCVGWFPVFIAVLFGLGMVVVTLFGTFRYPRTPGEDKEPEQVVLFEKTSTVVEPAVIEPLPAEPIAAEDEEAPFEDLAMPEAPVEAIVAKPEAAIEDLNLGARVNNVLNDAGLMTVDDVLQKLEKGDEALLEINGFGEKSLSDLKKALFDSGYTMP